MAQPLTPAHFAVAVERARKAAGLSINETADLADMPRTTFKRKRKTGKFDSEEQPKVAAALGTTPKALWAAAEQVPA